MSLLLVTAVFALDANQYIVTFVGGRVIYRSGNNGDWHLAHIKQVLPAGTMIKTAENAAIQLKSYRGDIIKIAPSSIFTIKKTDTTGELLFDLAVGRIFGKISKLKKDEKMSINTPIAVAGVRGTRFILQVQENADAVNIYVSEGCMTFGDNNKKLPKRKLASINNDGSWKIVRPTKQMVLSLYAGIPIAPRLQADTARMQNKAIIQAAHLSSKTDMQSISSILSQRRSTDIVAGRTLIDVDGDVTRVEERYMRPAKDVVQVVILNERDSGLTLKLWTIDFTKDLPIDFSQTVYYLPTLFESDDNSFYIEDFKGLTTTTEGKRPYLYRHVTLNGSDWEKNIVSKEIWTRLVNNNSANWRDFNNDGIGEIVKIDIPKNNTIFKSRGDARNGNIPVTTAYVYYNYVDPTFVDENGADPGENTMIVQVFAINNEGEDLLKAGIEVSTDDLDGSINDLFFILGQTAVNLIYNFDPTDLNNYEDDIDLVITPDLPVALIQELM